MERKIHHPEPVQERKSHRQRQEHKNHNPEPEHGVRV